MIKIILILGRKIRTKVLISISIRVIWDGKREGSCTSVPDYPGKPKDTSKTVAESNTTSTAPDPKICTLVRDDTLKIKRYKRT